MTVISTCCNLHTWVRVSLCLPLLTKSSRRLLKVLCFAVFSLSSLFYWSPVSSFKSWCWELNLCYFLQGIFHFQLGRGEPMLHTRLRPHCKAFLEKIAKLYELHVFTFGSRLYAHTIAGNRLIRTLPQIISTDFIHPHWHRSVAAFKDSVGKLLVSDLYCLIVSIRGRCLLVFSIPGHCCASNVSLQAAGVPHFKMHLQPVNVLH